MKSTVGWQEEQYEARVAAECPGPRCSVKASTLVGKSLAVGSSLNCQMHDGIGFGCTSVSFFLTKNSEPGRQKDSHDHLTS